jgi:hypothetical protein
MADTLGFLVDKISTINHKLYEAQEDLYRVRKMSEEEFLAEFSETENLKKLHKYFTKAMDLNVQRSAIIKEFDALVVKVIQDGIAGKNLDNGAFIQNQHKSY